MTIKRQRITRQGLLLVTEIDNWWGYNQLNWWKTLLHLTHIRRAEFLERDDTHKLTEEIE